MIRISKLRMTGRIFAGRVFEGKKLLCTCCIFVFSQIYYKKVQSLTQCCVGQQKKRAKKRSCIIDRKAYGSFRDLALSRINAWHHGRR